MRLYTITDGKYRLLFDKQESNNLQEMLDGNISIKNTYFCYYIENTVKKNFKELKKKYIMVMNVNYTSDYISVLVIAYDFNLNYNTPKSRRKIGKITEISFNNIKKFNKWIKDKKYLYKLIEGDNNYKAVLLNLNTDDSIDLALNSGINVIGNYNIIEYFHHEIVSNFT